MLFLKVHIPGLFGAITFSSMFRTHEIGRMPKRAKIDFEISSPILPTKKGSHLLKRKVKLFIRSLTLTNPVFIIFLPLNDRAQDYLACRFG